MRTLTIALNNQTTNNFYIYSDPDLEPRFKEIDWLALENLLKEAKNFNFSDLKLIGADPLAYSKINQLLKIASNLGYSIEIETERILDEKNINPVRNLRFLNGVNLREITFIIDDFSNEKFLDILKNIDLAKSFNLPFSLKFLVSSKNFHQVPEILAVYSAIADFGPQKIIIAEIWPVGEAKKQSLNLKLDEVAEYWPIVKNRFLPKGILAKSNFQENEFYSFLQGSEVIIDWNDSIKAFPFSKMEPIGNISQDKFSDLLKKLTQELNNLVKKNLDKGDIGGIINWQFYQEKLTKDYKAKSQPVFNWQEIDQTILPQSFSVLVTQKCNFQCDFCEFECSPDKEESLDLESFEKLLQEGKKIGISRIVLDGGEPLVWPNIKEGLKLCYQYGYKIMILTNGWYFKEFLPIFKKYGIKEFIFGINGASTKINDLIMGKSGAFERLSEAIPLAKKLGFFTGLHFVIHPLNFSKLNEFFNLAEKWNVDYIMTSRVVRIGRGTNPALWLSPKQEEKVKKIYDKHRDFLNKIQFYGVYQDEKRDLGCKYLARDGHLSIHWDGKIALCSMTPLLNLPLKKIQEGSLLSGLIYMNKINQRFQDERNKEFLTWKPELGANIHCEYCHQKFKNNLDKYFLN